MENFKKYKWLPLFIFMGIFFITTCSNTVWMQPMRFRANVEKIETLSIPDNLPDNKSTYQEWSRESEWIKIIDSSDASVYSNNIDLENLYLRWGELFFKIRWLQARTGEWDIKLQIQDIDNDKNEEALIIAIPKGSAHWEIDELQIIEQADEDTWVSVLFPLKDITSWVINNIEIDYGRNVRFLEKKLFCNKKIVSDKSISDIQFIFFSFYNNEIVLETIVETTEMLPVCTITISFSYRNQEFQVVSYDLMEYKNADL